MGVKGLWQLLEPVGRPVTLESLEGKVLSVDASILLNQAVKGMRDKSGQPLPNAHLIVLFNRLCKLLFYGIKPVFVFDGGVPILKKKTQAARRERKFKARYGSNKAAEKLVKNYLKVKALESVTGKRSGNTIFRNDSQRESDIFELHPTPEIQDKATNSSEEDKDNDVEISLLEQFYTQKEIEHQFQDPSSINVESEDFRSLPEEIQHELIKDMMEEKKWSVKHTVPQDALGFSDFQLQGVLQRGKLHQRLDELRKTMNSRNTGEIAGFSSQDASGAEFIVQSKRIVSEDTGHYILVKRSKIGNNDKELATIDNSCEGGFVREVPQTLPENVDRPLAPTFTDIDLTQENSSDSEPNSPLVDVPEIAVPSSWGMQVVLNTGEGKDTERRTSGCEGQLVSSSSRWNKEKASLNEVMDTKMEVGDLDEEKQTTNLVGGLTETESNEAEIQRQKTQIELLLKARQNSNTSPSCTLMCEAPSIDTTRPAMDDGETNQTAGTSYDEFVLRLESSGEDEKDDLLKKEVIPPLEKENNIMIVSDHENDDQDRKLIADKTQDEVRNNMEIEDEADTELKDDLNENEENNTAPYSLTQESSLVDKETNNVAAAVSEFAGSSREDLEVMQMNLEMEQSSIQSERARLERAAASVSNEMFTESQELLRLFGVPYQELLRLFGVPYQVSPMEAEAQCAFLDFTKQTHGTITDDSDIFLFGGRRVYKHLFNQNKHAELYTIEAINGNLALNRSKLIKLALITGSDYTEGIQGLGAVSAMEVLHEFNHEGFEALQTFKKWHDKTKNNKQKTQETKVKKKLRTVSLPTGFPSQEVFNSYINPVIDESRGSFEWGKPDLHSLRLFAKEKLGWDTSKTDDVLLPVLKQLNKDETQKRIDNFFQIKFQETRKKSSKRIRRVVNRFLNPLSESSSNDEKTKSTGSRNNRTATRTSRGRGRGTTRDAEAQKEGGDGILDQDLLDQSNGELEGLIEMTDLSCVDGKVGQTDSNGREPSTKQPMGNAQVRKDAEDWKQTNIISQKHDRIPQGDRETLSTVNSSKDKEKHDVKTCRGKVRKTANDFIFNTKECGFSGLRSVSEDSSTSSDTDSEEEQRFRVSSGNSTWKGRGDGGRKRPRGGGRGDRLKKTKTFNIS